MVVKLPFGCDESWIWFCLFGHTRHSLIGAYFGDIVFISKARNSLRAAAALALALSMLTFGGVLLFTVECCVLL